MTSLPFLINSISMTRHSWVAPSHFSVEAIVLLPPCLPITLLSSPLLTPNIQHPSFASRSPYQEKRHFHCCSNKRHKQPHETKVVTTRCCNVWVPWKGLITAWTCSSFQISGDFWQYLKLICVSWSYFTLVDITYIVSKGGCLGLGGGGGRVVMGCCCDVSTCSVVTALRWLPEVAPFLRCCHSILPTSLLLLPIYGQLLSYLTSDLKEILIYTMEGSLSLWTWQLGPPNFKS